MDQRVLLLAENRDIRTEIARLLCGDECNTNCSHMLNKHTKTSTPCILVELPSLEEPEERGGECVLAHSESQYRSLNLSMVLYVKIISNDELSDIIVMQERVDGIKKLVDKIVGHNSASHGVIWLFTHNDISLKGNESSLNADYKYKFEPLMVYFCGSIQEGTRRSDELCQLFDRSLKSAALQSTSTTPRTTIKICTSGKRDDLPRTRSGHEGKKARGPLCQTPISISTRSAINFTIEQTQKRTETLGNHISPKHVQKSRPAEALQDVVQSKARRGNPTERSQPELGSDEKSSETKRHHQERPDLRPDSVLLTNICSPIEKAQTIDRVTSSTHSPRGGKCNILLIGGCGKGKSKMIELLCDMSGLSKGGLNPITQDFCAYQVKEASWIQLIDSPSFGDSESRDALFIAQWASFCKTLEGDLSLVMYVRSALDRLDINERRSIDLISTIFGSEVSRRLAICLTHADLQDTKEVEELEAEIRGIYPTSDVLKWYGCDKDTIKKSGSAENFRALAESSSGSELGTTTVRKMHEARSRLRSDERKRRVELEVICNDETLRLLRSSIEAREKQADESIQLAGL